MLDDTVKEMTETLYEKFGFSFSYKSLSPSILTSFYVKGINIVDKEKNTILNIDKIKIDYNLFSLIKKDFTNFVKGVLIDGVDLNINDLLEIIPKSEKKESSFNISVSEIIEFIPDNTKLKNLNFTYNHEQADISYNVKNISLSGKTNNTAVELDIDSALNLYLHSLNRKVVCNLGLFGTITENLDNSQLNLGITDLVSGDIKMKKLNFHASYVDNIIDLHTIQVTDPISVGVFFDVNTHDFSAEVNTENMRLNTILSSWIKNPTVRKFRNSRVTTKTTVTTNLDEKHIKLFSDTDLYLPQSVVPGGLDVSFVLSGSEEKINIEKLKVGNEKISASANLAVKFKDLQVSGIVDIPYFVLPNGNVISTELYFDPLEKGFTCFSPQLYIGSKSLTALNLEVHPLKDSIDFSLEISDYSHMEETVPGLIRIEGSYLVKSNYLQSNISLNTLYLDSIANLAGELLPVEYKEKINSFEKTLSPYVFSGDVYCSTDFKSISYNVPYILLANVNDENQVFMVSLNGNEQSIQLDQISLVFGSFGLQLSGFLDRDPDSSDMFFGLDVTSSSIPYHITGSIMPQVCTIVGDYGTNVEIRFNEDESIEGFVEILGLPIQVGDKSIIISTYSGLNYDKIDGPRININRFETELIDTESPMNPRISFSGNATKYGIQLDSVSYADFYSALEGQTDIMIDFSGGILSSANINMFMQNPLTSESININGNIANPGGLGFSLDNLINNFYIDLQTQITDICLDRFVPIQSEKNKATGSIYASGTIAHPYVTLGIDNVSMYVGSGLFEASGNLLLEDRDLSIIGMDISYGKLNFQSFEAQASLEDFTLDASCNFILDSKNKKLETPLKITLNNAIIPEGKKFPDTFSASVVAENMAGSLIKRSFPVELSFFYNPDGIAVLSSDNIGLAGFFASDGIFELNIDNGSFFKAKADGFLARDIANIQLYDLEFDLRSIYNYLNMDRIAVFERGILKGEAVVTGSFAYPEINGNLYVNAPRFELPFISPAKLNSEEINIDIVNNVVVVHPILMTNKKGKRIQAGCNIYLDKWALDYVEGKVETLEDDLFPGHLLMKFAKLEGDVAVDLDLFFQDSLLEVTGKVFGENVELSSSLDTVTNILKNNNDKEEEEIEKNLFELNKRGFKIKTDIDVLLGTHASVNFSPILRCVLVPDTALRVVMDQETGSFGIDGDFKIRSGDIAYLNRSFYLKSGVLTFNSDDITNPLVTLLAEARERDDEGKPVKIILDVENQYLMELKPHFRSEPALSELEIQRILGQIAVADSENATDFLFAAGDYALQSTVIREVENKLRDLLNFDIFSVRTNVLQNMLNMGVSGDLTKENFSFGNFLDNSTVYIGKYLSSNIYLDAMLHISFEDNNFNDVNAPGSIIFQPEIGLEMESPFANIRFNLAPDLNALLKNNQFVPSTSVTLSWDFTF